jgi:hypothetical protein
MGGVPVAMVIMVIMGAMVVSVFMAVVPKFCLVEQEKEHQTHQKCQKQLMCTDFTFKGLGQQMQKRCGHQGPCGQAQHVLGVSAQDAKTQPGRQPNAANASHQGAHQNRQKSHHVSRSALHPKTNRPEGRF